MKPLCLDKYFKKTFIKIFDNYNTGIKSSKLQEAIEKVEELKEESGRIYDDMTKDRLEADKLLEKTENMKHLAKNFQRQSEEMENERKRNNFWL